MDGGRTEVKFATGPRELSEEVWKGKKDKIYVYKKGKCTKEGTELIIIKVERSWRRNRVRIGP